MNATNILGEYLFSLREKFNFSLNDVTEKTDITDTKLRRIEKGEVNEASPAALKKLAKLYNIKVVDLYIMAGFLDETDLRHYTQIFKGIEVLSDAEKTNIQEHINLINLRQNAQKGVSHAI